MEFINHKSLGMSHGKSAQWRGCATSGEAGVSRCNGLQKHQIYRQVLRLGGKKINLNGIG
jgi:hypothetical protein